MTYIREAIADDAERIADLSRQTFYETFAPYNTKENMEKFLGTQFTKPDLMKEVGARGNIFFIAFENDTPVGYAFLRQTKNPPALGSTPAIELARIYAASQVIGRGVGKLLMQTCLDKAKELKKEILWLGVWEKNDKALAFYLKWGFEKFGEHPFLLGDDIQTDWLMKKDLMAV